MGEEEQPMTHKTDIHRAAPNDRNMSHIVICSCGHQSLSSNEHLAELHAHNHERAHYPEAS